MPASPTAVILSVRAAAVALSAQAGTMRGSSG
jgi:hypothetical protein